MERPTMLYQAMLKDFGLLLGLSVERDVRTIAHRVEHEGDSFLEITLPTLSDALERGLESGRFTCPTSFSRHGELPRFLGGFLNLVFDRSGKVLPEPNADAIWAVRQICRFMKKLQKDCSPYYKKAAVQRFKEVEEELAMLTPQIYSRKDEILDKVARILWSQVLPEPDPNNIVCHHGPGVTADRYRPNNRRRIRYWYTRAEILFPVELYAYHNYWFAGGFDEGEGLSGVNGIPVIDIRDEPGVRVTFVPKTATTPRVIAIEPATMQFIQQGLEAYIVEQLETHRLTSRSIRFKDQSANQRLAYRSSIDRRLATLDLKDASDRVSLALVQRIFHGTPILEYLEVGRSLHATLPDGENLILYKYASMGSALCFPVEAMVFYTIIQAAIHKVTGRRPSSSSIRRFSADIDIYGDDIIVPVEYADAVVAELEAYGLRVNKNKSFRNSHFRESCGGDYFCGQSVKPIYARQSLPSNSNEWTARHVMAWCATANQFYDAGLWTVCQFIRDVLEGVLRSNIPRAVRHGPGVYFSSVRYRTQLRWNRRYQCAAQLRLVYQPLIQKDDIDGDATACFNRVFGSREDCSDDSSSWGSFGSRGSDHTWSTYEPGASVEVASGRGTSPRVCRLPGHTASVGPRGPSVRHVCQATARACEVHAAADRGVIDFSSSVKRGAFKPKHQWITSLT